MWIWLYRILFLPIFILLMPYYGYRMWKRGGYMIDFKYRLGWLPIIPKGKKTRIWLQAVSVGEVKAIEKLIDCFGQDGHFEIFLTTTSSTGYFLAKQLYGKKVTFVGLFPWDFWLFSFLAWERIQPDVVLLMEGELWPEHLQQAKNRNVPVFLVNARLSDRTYNFYLKNPGIAKWVFSMLKKICACSETNNRRFLDIGIGREKLQLTGNLKFDIDVPNITEEELINLKTELGFPVDANIILGSSTWPGEESVLIQCLRTIRRSSAEKWHLLLVPRHAERRHEILSILESSEFSWHQRSLGRAKNIVDICFVDTTGELSHLTSVANIVFIGKSLLKNRGGQSPLDAAAHGIPMVYGPYMSNFVSICQSIEALGGAIKVVDDVQAIQSIATLASDQQKRMQLEKVLKLWYKSNCGASELTYKIIAEDIADDKF